MMGHVYRRYNIPLILSETSHPGEHRPNWITSVSEECVTLIKQEIPLYGVCLYPIVSRPDWDNLDIWHHAGLWDIDSTGTDLTRTPNPEYAAALEHCFQLIADAHRPVIGKVLSNTGYGSFGAVNSKLAAYEHSNI